MELHWLVLLAAAPLLRAAQAEPAPRFLPPDPAPFLDRPPRGGRAFAVVAGDLEGDGDLDLIVNWHLLGPLEVFRNEGGRLALVPSSGLVENAGLPDVFADTEALLAELSGAKRPGVHVWHDEDRTGSWNLLAVVPEIPARPSRPAIRARATCSILVTATSPLVDLEGATARETDSASGREIELRLADAFPRHVRFTTRRIGACVALRAEINGHPGILRVGAEQAPVRGGEVALWLPDPHGLALLDVEGTPAPELCVSRGAQAGLLAPPLAPKRDAFFVGGGASVPFDRVDRLPPGYGRGRRLEWVDVEADGTPELYVGNHRSPNELLVRDGEAYVDRAGELGLAHEEGEAFAWLDLDGDGLDELVFRADAGLRVSRGRTVPGSTPAAARTERVFDTVDGASLGLRVPPAAGAAADDSEATPDGSVFLHRAISVADLDGDGRLDLLAGGSGPGRSLSVFRAEDGGGFADRTTTEVAAATCGARHVVVLDADADGRPDVLVMAGGVVLLHNTGAGELEPSRIDAGWPETAIHAVTAGDLDGDGLDDLVLIGDERRVARNASREAGAGRLDVALDAPGRRALGAVVCARHADGLRTTQRHGSAGSVDDSQVVGPLRFASPAENPVVALAIRWPGGATSEHVVAPGTTRLAPGPPGH